ncbi:hypothetical protein OH76DRAFT_1488049 [Lentinus brumalis]|uniref:F-box domain-containing protein n=1 Tax=Lentinus brumalis TaxID=2498619 RepID=A0A371CS84_9APHY|nr:hypothetical protein OH76DRAFT_1488049 [Polyporus brumalis]
MAPFDADILQYLVCHLDTRSAARASLVCSQWYRAATPIAYAHIFLHAGSWETSSALSRTLIQCAHLRHHVRYLTVIHCARYFPYMGNWLYGWLALVPEGSLRSCRAIGGAALVGSLLASPAVRAAPRLAIVTLFFKTSDDAVPHVELLTCHPEHIRLAEWERRTSDRGFLRRFFPHFQVKWGPDTRNTLYLSLAGPAAEGGVSLSELGEFLTLLSGHLARANFVIFTLGYTSSRPMPTGRELCEEGLAQVTRRPSRCQCASTPTPFVTTVPSDAPAVCAALIGGEPFSVWTARTTLECMTSSRTSPPVWAHVAILRVAGVTRGKVCEMCGVQLYAVFQPSFDDVPT